MVIPLNVAEQDAYDDLRPSGGNVFLGIQKVGGKWTVETTGEEYTGWGSNCDNAGCGPGCDGGAGGCPWGNNGEGAMSFPNDDVGIWQVGWGWTDVSENANAANNNWCICQKRGSDHFSQQRYASQATPHHHASLLHFPTHRTALHHTQLRSPN